ncbi:hypothetical protein VNO77_43948 [Canavalia gladiata]|uniref:Uncharacterized protein n=1 Tax=Canavalia gladiata TaxID=3824 RepID=A0AAN9PPX1_CANGL
MAPSPSPVARLSTKTLVSPQATTFTIHDHGSLGATLNPHHNHLPWAQSYSNPIGSNHPSSPSLRLHPSVPITATRHPQFPIFLLIRLVLRHGCSEPPLNLSLLFRSLGLCLSFK